MPLVIKDVTADPALSFLTGGPGGTSMHTMQFTGTCNVVKERSGLFGSRSSVRTGFYVPTAGPFRPSHLLSAWVEVSLAAVSVIGGQGPTQWQGVGSATVQLVDDELGSGSMWPYVWLSLLGGESMYLRYRLTVTQPLDRP